MIALSMSSSGGAFPLALSDPVKPCTPFPQHPYPNKGHLSFPIKPVVPHFADHKSNEVQVFGYDKDLHQLAAFGEQDFIDFLGIDDAFAPSASVNEILHRLERFVSWLPRFE